MFVQMMVTQSLNSQNKTGYGEWKGRIRDIVSMKQLRNCGSSRDQVIGIE